LLAFSVYFPRVVKSVVHTKEKGDLLISSASLFHRNSNRLRLFLAITIDLADFLRDTVGHLDERMRAKDRVTHHGLSVFGHFYIF
jgi:hypothetical protein